MMRFRVSAFTACCALLFLANSVHGGSLQKLVFLEGDDIEMGLRSPVLDASDVTLSFVEFTEAFDRDASLFQPRKPKFMGGNVRPKLASDVSVGAFLAEALEREARLMGFATGDGGWKIGGRIEHLRVNYRSPAKGWSVGAVLYYGEMNVRLEVSSPDGAQEQIPLRIHFYSPGGGGRSKSRVALTRQLMQAAQEVILFLSQRRFEAPAHPSISEMLDQLQAAGGEGHDELVEAIGLSGSEEAVPVFLDLLKQLEDKDDRAPIILALARIRSPNAVPLLASRYSEEKVDARWYTLKAMAYIGTPEAIALVRAEGLKDTSQACSDLAESILER